jgi:hypothetical protein
MIVRKEWYVGEEPRSDNSGGVVWSSDLSDDSTEILNSSEPYLLHNNIDIPTNMASIELLEGVLEGSQVPHQPLLIITETVTQSGLPLFTEVLKRSEQALVPFPGSR